MKSKTTLFFAAIFVFLIGTISSIALAQEDIKQSQISNLVRSLGYGAAIHNFKNYVLRGKDKYRQNASQHFDTAKTIIASLRNNQLSNEESMALNEIEKVVNDYQAALLTIQEQIESEKNVAEIIITADETAKVDDKPAIDGIATLRKGYQWSELEALEYALGYGAAIHNFKNYLLRGRDDYKSNTENWFSEAEKAAAKINEANLSDEEQTALADILHTIKAYQKGLLRIESTADKIQNTQHKRLQSLMISSSDKMVKVDDGPAMAGLAVLGKR